MLLAALALVQAVSAPVQLSGDSATYSGREQRIAVRPPRAETEIRIDGVLDEAVWQSAARLTGFSQFVPLDGIAAGDSTEVRVWYSPTAVYFGIRAYAVTGPVIATRADRDRISADDHIQILLSTFANRTQATVFGVNPHGVQMDGILVETGQTTSGSFGGMANARQAPDLSPDYVFQSAGRLTEWGYELEVRIPFKSLRFQSESEQTWGLNIVRRIQHSGVEDTWAPARRSGASYLGQMGTLQGLRDLQRGVVLDLNPSVTAKATGRSSAADWEYQTNRPEFGGNVRWGITNNLTLNGTVNPDFSHVEADAGQLSFDPRRALQFQEKRPFFLDGIEQFQTPNQLIYTRAIRQPVAAAKVTGKHGNTSIALLTALDDRAHAGTAENPMFAVMRVQRDLGGQSRLGLVYTDRTAGSQFNRVASVDTRLVFRKLYNLQAQLAGSATRVGDDTRTAPLWEARLDRNGRTFGARYIASGIAPDFEAQSGFISRRGVAKLNANHRVTLYRPRGSLIQSTSHDIGVDGSWQYDRFMDRRDAQDKKLHFNNNVRLRGGWTAGVSLFLETFGFDPALFTNYRVAVPRAGGAVDTVAFTGTARLPNDDWVFRLGTPQFKRWSANGYVILGRDDNFHEWSSADIFVANLSLDFRPSERLRLNAQYQEQAFDRRTDGSRVAVRRLPRLKAEYQVSRAIFVRVVGEYDAQFVDSLRDDSRTNAPLLRLNARTGLFEGIPARRSNVLRADWLFSYQPVPGTVVFFGYGNTMREPHALNFDRLRRETDGFFVKMSYLYRL